MIRNLLYLFILVFAGFSCVTKEKEALVNFPAVKEHLLDALDETIKLTDSLKSESLESEASLELFRKTRLAYKKAEVFSTMLNSEAAKRVNGPPLPVFREDNGKVLPSVGFQAIEELVVEEDPDKDELKYKVQITLGYLNLLKDQAEKIEINPKRFFLPIHQQFLQIFALGMTGFDTPATLWGLDESARSLENIGEIYQLGIGDTIQLVAPELHADFLRTIELAVASIDENNDFNTFDRYAFGRDYLNKLTAYWVQIRQISGLWDDPKIYALNLDAPNFFEEDAFNLNFFRSSYNRNPNEQQIALGEKLFFDSRLSANGKLSCSSCHNPANSYQDGLKTGLDKEGNPLLRNTPTIINSAFQKRFFWDGRSDNLESQITSVFSNEKEFDNSGHDISSAVVEEDTAYQNLFSEVYPGQEFDKTRIIRAIASYTSTLNALNSRFDKNMRGELDDFTEQEKLGLNLYMGKALCATCHFVPLTNGTVPPVFSDTEREILGTPQTASNLKVDDDEGFYFVYEVDIHRFMFKTPTIRNAELTAPYMHNGVYNSLEQVMDFYNKGGGAGMGFDLPHQTLPFDSLSLTFDEQEAIIAFMKTLTDTTVMVFSEEISL